MLVKDKSPNKSQMKAIESQMNSICFRFPPNHQKFGSQTFCKQAQSKKYSLSKLISFNLLNLHGKGCVTILAPQGPPIVAVCQYMIYMGGQMYNIHPETCSELSFSACKQYSCHKDQPGSVQSESVRTEQARSYKC